MTRFPVRYPADPEVLRLLDAAAAPLCVMCRASFRDERALVCPACRYEREYLRGSEAA